MPRETIITSRFPGDDNFNVKVGWNRDMDVQIGINESLDRSMWWVYGGKRVEEIGHEISKIVEQAEREFPGAHNEEDRDTDIGQNVLNLFDTMLGSFDSMWSTLNRKDINDLIRVLRRARDSAFGRDE